MKRIDDDTVEGECDITIDDDIVDDIWWWRKAFWSLILCPYVEEHFVLSM